MRATVEERLSAIMAVEVPDFDRRDGDRTGFGPALQQAFHEVVDAAIGIHGGRVFELAPDHTLVEFIGAREAVRCAVDIQQGLAARQQGLPEAERVALRIGMHYGPITVERGEVRGEGLTIAQRVKALTAPGEICLSRTVVDQVKGTPGLAFEDLAAIPGRPVPAAALAFRLRASPPGPPRMPAWVATAGRLGLTALIAAAAVWLATTGGQP